MSKALRGDINLSAQFNFKKNVQLDDGQLNYIDKDILNFVSLKFN